MWWSGGSESGWQQKSIGCARWNYAFRIQNEELCWGKGKTAEAVRKWIAAQGLGSREEEIAGVFRGMLVEVVRNIHASGLLKKK